MLKELYRDLKEVKSFLFKLLNPQEEAEFQQYYNSKYLKSTQAATVISILLVSFFGPIDVLMLPDTYILIWKIRYLILVPFLFLLLLSTYTKLKRYTQFCLFLGVLSIGLSLSVILYFAQPHEPAYHYYFPGYLLVIMGAFSMLRLRLKYSIAATALITISYILVATLKQNMHTENPAVLLTNFAFIISIELIGIMAGITIEYYQRKDFIQAKTNEKRREALEHETLVASRIQQSILPGQDVYQDKHITVNALYLPMTNVGGDFYDFVTPKEGLIGVLIADVSGHGMSAALIASMLKVSFHSASAPWDRPDLILKKINHDLFQKIGISFVTAAYLSINMKKKKAAISQAGHPPVLVQDKEKSQIKKYKPGGGVLGIEQDVKLNVDILNLSGDKRFLMCTDGFHEALEKTNEFKQQQLNSILEKLKNHPPRETLAQLQSYMQLSESSPDDITIVLVDTSQFDTN